MSTYDLEEQEQLAALKGWWKENGGKVAGGVALLFGVVATWQAWSWHQRSQAAQAAALYDTLQKAARGNDAKAARDAAGTILENFPRTAYAPLAALVSAKIQFQAGDRKTARAQLEWAVDHASIEEVQAIARLRLSSVLLDEGDAEAALKVLSQKPKAEFESLFASQRGDVLAAQGKASEVRAEYRNALDKTEAANSAWREALRARLDTLE